MRRRRREQPLLQGGRNGASAAVDVDDERRGHGGVGERVLHLVQDFPVAFVRRQGHQQGELLSLLSLRWRSQCAREGRIDGGGQVGAEVQRAKPRARLEPERVIQACCERWWREDAEDHSGKKNADPHRPLKRSPGALLS